MGLPPSINMPPAAPAVKVVPGDNFSDNFSDASSLFSDDEKTLPGYKDKGAFTRSDASISTVDSDQSFEGDPIRRPL